MTYQSNNTFFGHIMAESFQLSEWENIYFFYALEHLH